MIFEKYNGTNLISKNKRNKIQISLFSSKLDFFNILQSASMQHLERNGLEVESELIYRVVVLFKTFTYIFKKIQNYVNILIYFL